jgi:dephospho-CoA kinase
VQSVLNVGLTGGIGSGKSAVSALLVEKGAVLNDLDQVARDVVEPGQPALTQIVEKFGAGLLLPDGRLNRPAMAETVFNDPEQRKVLEGIIFKEMAASSQRKREKAIAELGDQAIFVTDAPILFETNMQRNMIGVIVVEAPLEVRLARLKEGRGIDEEDARKRIAIQVDDEYRRERARWILDNGGSLEQLRVQVDDLWQRLVALNAKVVELGLEPSTPIPLDQPLPSEV